MGTRACFGLLRWLFVLALFLFACGSESDALKAYKTFAGAYLNGSLDKAQALATGAATQRLQNMRNPPPGQPYVLPLKETVREVHGVVYKVESETPDADGMSLVVRVVAKVDRPGTHSTSGSDTATFEHTVHLKKVGDAWKVDKFEDRELPR